MEQLLLTLFGRKKPQKFRKLKFEKKQYPIRELNHKEFEKWCEEFKVGCLWDRKILHMEIR